MTFQASTLYKSDNLDKFSILQRLPVASSVNISLLLFTNSLNDTAKPCYVYGKMSNGFEVDSSKTEGSCKSTVANNPFRFTGQKWIVLTVTVPYDSFEQIRIQGDMVDILSIRQAETSYARGGVIAKKGDLNIVEFKDFSITTLSSASAQASANSDDFIYI